jgi:hypothetical protein
MPRAIIKTNGTCMLEDIFCVLTDVKRICDYEPCIVCTFSILIIVLVYSNFFACHKHIYDEMSLKSSDKLIRIM